MRPFCISQVYFCAVFLKYTIMINYSDYYSEYFFDCFQNSDLTKETLKMYASQGSNDALALLYLGMTTRRAKYEVRHYLDEDTMEILFVKRVVSYEQENIFDAEEGEVEEIEERAKEVIAKEEKYKKFVELM